MLNLDTHMVVALVDGSLNEGEARALVEEELAISDIVLWELAKLVELGRLKLDLDSPKFRDLLRTLTAFPITLDIARISTRLDFASDPADEIIAATSVVHGIPLMTRDRTIRGSRMVPLAPV